MKKIKLLLLFISLLILPSISYALDSNNKNIYIDSVDVIEKSNNTEILNPASFNGLTINSDIKFLEKNDYIIYKVMVTPLCAIDYPRTEGSVQPCSIKSI